MVNAEVVEMLVLHVDGIKAAATKEITESVMEAVSYTHLTLPTIYSV